MLTIGFEKIMMKDDESFDYFCAKLNNIVNPSFNLGEQIPEAKIGRKVRRSLSEKLKSKATSIEESKDLDAIKIEELVVSHRTFELNIPHSRKGKFIALNTVRKSINYASDDEKLKDDDIAFIARKF